MGLPVWSIFIKTSFHKSHRSKIFPLYISSLKHKPRSCLQRPGPSGRGSRTATQKLTAALLPRPRYPTEQVSQPVRPCHCCPNESNRVCATLGTVSLNSLARLQYQRWLTSPSPVSPGKQHSNLQGRLRAHKLGYRKSTS